MNCKKCGSPLLSNSIFCNECGTKVINDISKTNVKETKTAINDINIDYSPMNSAIGKLLELIDLVDKKEGWNEEVEKNKISKSTKKKVDIIKNFPIPDNKEDIINFFVYANANVDEEQYNVFNFLNKTANAKSISEAWLSKLEQAYQKANLKFSNDEEFAKIKENYLQKLAKIEKLKHARKITLSILGGVIAVLILFITILTNV